MTCIVGIVDNGTIHMGSDRGASSSGVIVSTLLPKISMQHNFLVGYSGDGFGVGQLATLADYPADDKNLEITLRTIFCKSLSKLVDKYGGADNGSHEILIGGYGRLFEIYTDDWGIIEVSQSAVGSGSDFALGSLYTTIGMDTTHRITTALAAAITLSPSCQGPIDMFSL
jgi:20S proteasome alpha/beta subunit